MELNKKKSGVVVFAPRHAKKIPLMKIATEIGEKGQTVERKWVLTQQDINAVPIVTKYKYLGTYLDSKLTMKTQFDHIKKKADFLFVKLYPYLSNATADARKDMWRTMVLPLFNAILILIYFERAKTETWRILRLLIGTFKKFMMIPKTTSTNLVAEMMGINFEELVQVNAVNSEEKWDARKERRFPDLVYRSERHNYLKGIPNKWCHILKQQCMVCPVCKNGVRNESHMEIYHLTHVLDYKEIWKHIKEVHEKMTEEQRKKNKIIRVKRRKFLEYWKPRLDSLAEDTATKFKFVYSKST